VLKWYTDLWPTLVSFCIWHSYIFITNVLKLARLLIILVKICCKIFFCIFLICNFYNIFYVLVPYSQDHLTKFCVLRPLSSKRAAEVAWNLVDIFLLIGAPHILQSDNGREFTATVVSELKEIWPDLLLVHGKPRHPQSQGSVERCNGDVKDILTSWLSDNNSTDWTVGLKFVQFLKNTSHHSGINQTPYKALFGCEPRIGLRSTTLPTEVIETLLTEEDFEAVFNFNTQDQRTAGVAAEPGQTNDSPAEPCHAEVSAESVAIEVSAEPLAVQVSSEPVVVEASSASVAVEEEPGLSQQDSDHRKRARDGLMKQAERMVRRSRFVNIPGNVGDNVTVPVPLVDRGRGDSRNIMGVILDRDENDLYRIAVKGGILNGRFSRNQFDLCSQILLLPTDVCREAEISLRNAVKYESICGGQGFLKCNCSGKSNCESNRCKCFKAKVECNSRCHGSMTCKNKH
jgi:hypothetical protein